MSEINGLVGLTVVKNECDIIEAMIRHNLQYLDALFVVDNNSGDPTPKIVSKLCAEFHGRLFLRHDGRTGHRQQMILNDLLHELGSDHDIACFVPLDADEMIRADREVFRRCLLSASRPIHLPWVTFVPSAQDDLAQPNPILRIRHRRVDEGEQTYKTTFPKALLGKTRLKPGSHSVAGRAQFDHRIIEGLSLAHFPIRTKEQLWSKAVIGALNMRLRESYGRREGAQWHKIHRQILLNGGLSDEQFYHEALHYATRGAMTLTYDPLATALEAEILKYTVNLPHMLALRLTAFADECVSLIASKAQE